MAHAPQPHQGAVVPAYGPRRDLQNTLGSAPNAICFWCYSRPRTEDHEFSFAGMLTCATGVFGFPGGETPVGFIYLGAIEGEQAPLGLAVRACTAAVTTVPCTHANSAPHGLYTCTSHWWTALLILIQSPRGPTANVGAGSAALRSCRSGTRKRTPPQLPGGRYSGGRDDRAQWPCYCGP